jgi:hypothetical protein
MKDSRPNRYFQDSWRPEDKALESAEEEQLEAEYPVEIARQRAERHKSTPPLRGFEMPPRVRQTEPKRATGEPEE